MLKAAKLQDFQRLLLSRKRSLPLRQIKTIVSIRSAQRDIAISHLRRSLILIARDVLQHEGVPPTRVDVSFISDDETRKLHLEHFNDPSPTDCMTFPFDAPEDAQLPDGFLGEIFICPKTAIFESVKNKTSISFEISLYLVHGLLHLIGYEDSTECKRKTMKLREKFHLDRLVKKRLVT